MTSSSPAVSVPYALQLQGVRIVLVDDSEDARDVVAHVLCCHGAFVSAVGTAEEAYALVVALAPELLISDIAMPTEDGYSLIRRVRALRGRLGSTPAIALSAFDDPDDVRHALCAGFDAHVAKGSSIAVIVGVVRELSLRWASGCRPILQRSS